MQYHKLKMKIIDSENDAYKIMILSGKEKTYIYYNTEIQEIDIPLTNSLSVFLDQHAHQLHKILRNKPEHTFYKGCKLAFVIPSGQKQEINPFQKNLIAAINHRKKPRKVQWIQEGKPNICTIYTDASYNDKLRKGAFSIITKKHKNMLAKKYKSANKGNNLLELEAVIKGLRLNRRNKELRIVTDSRYVIRGITEWVQIWKRNKWTTASGQKVKHKKYWIKLYKLTKGKYTEFQWVKSHSHHAMNNLCDFMAKSILYQE
jgi:ribonuclease HI